MKPPALPLAARYRHTNLVARDWRRLAEFYQRVFGCVPVPPERDLRGEWLARGSGVPGARVRGIHLRLPGAGANGPTLELFEYQHSRESEGAQRGAVEASPSEPSGTGASVGSPPRADRPGFGHIAFEVDDVGAALAGVIAAGGSALGEVVRVPIAGAGIITWTYACDPEGNILELQRWQRP